MIRMGFYTQVAKRRYAVMVAAKGAQPDLSKLIFIHDLVDVLKC